MDADIKLEGRVRGVKAWGVRNAYIADNADAKWGRNASKHRAQLIEKAIEDRYRWEREDPTREFRVTGLNKQEELKAFPTRRRVKR